MVEKQTIFHLNALMCGSKILGEQLCCSVRGCHATSSLNSVLFRRKVVWQPQIELYSCTWHILEPTSRATKWDIICLHSLSGFLYNPLRLKLGKVGVEQICNRVYFIIYILHFFKPWSIVGFTIFCMTNVFKNCRGLKWFVAKFTHNNGFFKLIIIYIWRKEKQS